jgi:hypothetical protein
MSLGMKRKMVLYKSRSGDTNYLNVWDIYEVQAKVTPLTILTVIWANR